MQMLLVASLWNLVVGCFNFCPMRNQFPTEKFTTAFVGQTAMSFAVVALFFVRYVLVVPFWHWGCRGSLVVFVLRIVVQHGRVGGRFLVLLLLRFVG